MVVAVLAAVVLIARGICLGRRVTVGHALAACAAVCIGVCAHLLSLGLVGNILVAGSGFVLMWPNTARPQPSWCRRCGSWSTPPVVTRWRLLPCIRVKAITRQRRSHTAPGWGSRSSVATRSVMSTNSICWFAISPACAAAAAGGYCAGRLRTAFAVVAQGGAGSGDAGGADRS